VNDTRWLCSRGFTRHAGSPAPRGSTRYTEPEVRLEQALEGKQAQESTDPTTSPWPGRGSPRERTHEGSKASKWACRPFTGEPDGLRAGLAAVGALRRVRRTCPGAAGNLDSRPMRPASLRACRGKGSAPGGKQRSCSVVVAPAAVEREPTRKQRPAKAGTAPREGKALKGIPGTRAAWNKAAKLRGVTENGVPREGCDTIRVRCQHRREGQEP
jgi:hypothetical protein